MKCMGCGHQIMVPRKMVEKNTRNVQVTAMPMDVANSRKERK